VGTADWLGCCEAARRWYEQPESLLSFLFSRLAATASDILSTSLHHNKAKPLRPPEFSTAILTSESSRSPCKIITLAAADAMR